MNIFKFLFGKRPEKKKVFCGDCRFMKCHNQSGDYGFYCHNEYLVVNSYSRDNYLRRGTGEIIDTKMKLCSDLNEKNNCFFFKPREK
jgi:hypothetical protein